MFVPARRLSFGWSLVLIIVVFLVGLGQSVAKQAPQRLAEKQRQERLAAVQSEAGIAEMTQQRTNNEGIGWYRGRTADGQSVQAWVTQDGITWTDEAKMLTPNAAKAKAEELGWIRLEWLKADVPTWKLTWEFHGSRPEWEGAWASVGVNVVTGEVKYAPPVMPRIDPEEWQESWTEATLAATPITKVERIEHSEWRVTLFVIGPDATGRPVQAWLKLKQPEAPNPADQVFVERTYQAPVPEIMGWVYLDGGISRASAIERAERAGLVVQEQPILDWLPQPLWLFRATNPAGERVSVHVDWKSGALTWEPIKAN